MSGAFRTPADLLHLKHTLDMGNEPYEDRAVVLDWDDNWKRHVSELLFNGKEHIRPSFIFGFRILWRETTTTVRYSM